MSYTSGVWPRVCARARPCAARTRLFWAHYHAKQGAARPPPAFAASLILIYPPKLFLRTELGTPGVRISIH